MADDPWAQFAEPSPAAAPAAGKDDPWAQFVAPPPAAAPSVATSAPVSAPQSDDDWILTHLAKWAVGYRGPNAPPTYLEPRSLSQAGSDADAFVRKAVDTGSWGLADKAIGGTKALLGQGSAQDEAQRTQQAGQWLGPYASAAADITGTLMNPLTRVGGGIVGGTAAGAGIGAVSAFGHDQNLGVGAAEGAAAGLGGTLVGKALSPAWNAVANRVGKWTGALSTPEAITGALKGARDDAYDALKNVTYEPTQGPDALLPALQGIKQGVAAIDPAGNLSANSRSVAALDALINRTADPLNPHQTAESILSTRDLLSKFQGPTGGAENDIAPVIKTGLDNYLENANPSSLHDAGDAVGMIQKAKDAHQLYANARDLQQAGESLKGFGSSPAGWAQNTAESFYNNPKDPRYQALARVAKYAGGDPGGQSTYGLVHGIVHPAIEGAAFATLPPGIAPAAAAAATYLGAKPAIGAALGGRQTARTMDAISQAYPSLTGLVGPPGPAPRSAGSVSGRPSRP